MVRRKHIRALVGKLLSSHHVDSVPIPIEKIAIESKVKVIRQVTKDELSGFLYVDRAKSHSVIGVNSNHSPQRQRFTIAHELGHFFLHDFRSVHVDKTFQMKLRNEKSKLGTDIEEKEANLFAAELLMPVSFLERDVKRLRAFDIDDEEAIAKLAEKYEVSRQAMLIRMTNLNYVAL